jgi:hypothetical protein
MGRLLLSQNLNRYEIQRHNDAWDINPLVEKICFAGGTLLHVHL